MEQNAGGFYDQGKDIIFVRAGSIDEVAGTLIHEATHRLGNANPFRGDNFVSEAIAEFAESDFYKMIYSDAGPLAGETPISPHVRKLYESSEVELMADIEERYHRMKSTLPGDKAQQFLNLDNKTPDDILRELFKDVAADYESKLPHR